jgi:hypothetical protein
VRALQTGARFGGRRGERCGADQAGGPGVLGAQHQASGQTAAGQRQPAQHQQGRAETAPLARGDDDAGGQVHAGLLVRSVVAAWEGALCAEVPAGL